MEGEPGGGGGGGERKGSLSSLSSSPSTTVVGWRPSQFQFRPYSIEKQQKPQLSQNDVAGAKGQRPQPQSLRVVIRKSVVTRLTKDLIETYKTCNQHFHYSEDLNPKRFLTSPSVGVLNDGYDNANSDLILAANLVLVNHESQRRYIVKDVLGQGTFGQVAKCWVADSSSFVAVKIIKNQPAYYQQAWVEVSILSTLNQKFDPEDKHHIVRIYDHFVHHRHLCIVFELLDTNLFELIKINHFRGLSLSIVQLFSKQILRGLSLLKDAAVIHCDLKPENILLCTSVKPAEVKIIDFGSACMENRTVYSYIQSRYYRSPEVLLGYQYSTAIDMWSFGCIVAELFLGLPLFPGASEFDLLKRMIKILGGQPPDYVLNEAKNTSKFFKFVGNANHEESISWRSAFQALTEEEYEARELKKASIGKEYFNHMNLEAIVTKYPYRKNLPEEDIVKETQARLALIDFLRGLVEFDPAKRWSPVQASKHPFVTGEPFTNPYKPPPETPRMTVSQTVRVDHNPAGGHWFAAGLSPNIPGGPRVAMHNSPHFQMLPYGYSGSYGSLGSHGGSYTEGPVLGCSYGSYGDNSNMLPYYSPAGPSWIKPGVAMPGNSPDSRRRVNFPSGNGLGVSPSVGNFAPTSLGTSPSQFTPPGSYGLMSAGSPKNFGPTSPARGSHGSPFGKMPAAVNQFNRRKSWAYSGNLQSEGSSSSSHWHRQANDSSFSGQTDLHLLPNSNASSGQQQGGDSRMSNGYSSTHRHDKHEATAPLPDPGDWDPNYSEELLLQDDCSDVSSLSADFSNGIRLGQGLVHTEPPVNVRRSNHLSRSSVSTQRPNGPIQAFSGGEMGSPPSGHNLHGHPVTKPPSHFMSHMQQSAPSRFGQQQSSQRFNQIRPHGTEWNHSNFQPSSSIYSSVDPQLPGNSSFTNGAPWGHRSNHPNASIPPASRGRKNYGRVAQ